jgi:hypothetical protein
MNIVSTYLEHFLGIEGADLDNIDRNSDVGFNNP